MSDRIARRPRLTLLLCVAPLALMGSCTESGGGPHPWTAQQQADWYSGTQGSRLLPLAWARALEQADSETRFLDDANVARFRLLPRPGALPVGFAIDDNDDTNLTVSKLRWFTDQQSKEKWVGLNCSACHTAEIDYQGKAYRVDGGPSLFDYQGFVEHLDASLHATLDSATAPTPAGTAKWDRFAVAVLGTGHDTPVNRTQLQIALKTLVAWEDKVEAINATQSRYGYGRVDAFGHIYNKVSLFNGAANPTRNPASAPVSYPFLWDIYRHDFLQYNGVVQNQRIGTATKYIDVGALGRNTGEVIGVFGDVAVTPNPGLTGYKSSVWADNLERLERQLSTLPPPKWPVEFGATGDISAGKTVFAAHCQSCHAPQPGTAPYKVTLVPLKANDPNATDPWMACNAISYRSAPGNLQGTPEGYLSGAPYGPDPAPIVSMLTTTVKGTLAGKKGQIVAQFGRIFLGIGGSPRVVLEEAPDRRPMILDACFAANSPLMRYKARPLDGVWATAPFLHNGSVPSLYELLLPPAQRTTRFPIGTRTYDPIKAGYSIDPTAPGNGFLYDTTLQGNSNAGHDYGAATLTPGQRTALLQYLKSL